MRENLKSRIIKGSSTVFFMMNGYGQIAHLGMGILSLLFDKGKCFPRITGKWKINGYFQFM
jgi:hypothetical protein